MYQALCLALIFFLIYSCGTPSTYNITSQGEIISETQDIKPGKICLYGGVRINIGADKNKNGLLDNDEIAHTQNICKDKTENIIESATEPPGENCPNGGVHIKIGNDKNNDNIIQDDEIAVDKYICHQPEIIEDVIDVKYIEGDLCSAIQIEISNNTKQITKLHLLKSENIAIVAHKDRTNPYAGAVMEKETTFPIEMAAYESRYLNLKIQPFNDNEEILFYSIYGENSTDNKSHSDFKICSTNDNAVNNIRDIIEQQDIFITSYYDDPDKNAECIVSQPCFLGMPYGIRKGLFPIDVKIDWDDGNDGNEGLIELYNLSYLPIASHIFSTSGNFSVKIDMKTKNSIRYLQITKKITVK